MEEKKIDFSTKTRKQVEEAYVNLATQFEELKKAYTNEHNKALQIANTNDRLKAKLSEVIQALQEANTEEYYTNINLACRITENKDCYTPDLVKKMQAKLTEHFDLMDKVDQMRKEEAEKKKVEKSEDEA